MADQVQVIAWTIIIVATGYLCLVALRPAFSALFGHLFPGKTCKHSDPAVGLDHLVHLLSHAQPGGQVLVAVEKCRLAYTEQPELNTAIRDLLAEIEAKIDQGVTFTVLINELGADGRFPELLWKLKEAHPDQFLLRKPERKLEFTGVIVDSIVEAAASGTFYHGRFARWYDRPDLAEDMTALALAT